MSEYKNFPLDFIERTLKLVKEYKGDYEVTLFVNCLLGLLVLHNEYDAIKHFISEEKKNGKWQPFLNCVENWGETRGESLENFMKSMRNSLAHFQLKPIHKNQRVQGFCFGDKNGFKASLTNKKIEEFTKNLLLIAEKALKSQAH